MPEVMESFRDDGSGVGTGLALSMLVLDKRSIMYKSCNR